MIEAKSLGDEQFLGVDHVVVAVARKFGAQAVAWFARNAATNGVGYDQIIFGAIERLPAAEELGTKTLKDGFSAAASAVKQ